MSEAIIEVLPDFWAAAIVNGDETGMDDDDSRAFNAWIKEFQEDNGVIFTANVFSDEAQFVTYHHAKPFGVLACNCHQYAFVTEHTA